MAELQAQSLGEQLGAARGRLLELAADIESIQEQKREATNTVEALQREVTALRAESQEFKALLAAAQLEAAGKALPPFPPVVPR